MIKYTNYETKCLIEKDDDSAFLVNLRSGTLKGRTGCLMWLFPKKAHCLSQDGIVMLKNNKAFRSENNYISLAILLGAVFATFYKDILWNIHLNISWAIYFIFTLGLVLLAFMLNEVGMRKDDKKIKDILGEVNYESEVVIDFYNTRDKRKYFLKMICLTLVGSTAFFGFGLFLIFSENNPIGLFPVFIYAYVLFGTAFRLPKKYKVSIKKE